LTTNTTARLDSHNLFITVFCRLVTAAATEAVPAWWDTASHSRPKHWRRLTQRRVHGVPRSRKSPKYPRRRRTAGNVYEAILSRDITGYFRSASMKVPRKKLSRAAESLQREQSNQPPIASQCPSSLGPVWCRLRERARKRCFASSPCVAAEEDITQLATRFPT